MCFSASASFTAGTVLLIGGIVSVRKVEKPRQVPFAAIPLLFSLQQFTEGFLWMSIKNPDHAGWKPAATFVFLLFAQVIWPFWVPLSVWMIEKKGPRKKILLGFLCMGFVAACYLGTLHIRYDLDFPKAFMPVCAVFYFVCTIIPPLFSSLRRMPILGGIILCSFLISYVFFQEYLVSVWCFFAACISILVLYIDHSFSDAKT
jgi:hypothetical protein